jgi:uncharacterized protein (UPF0333 family)
MASGQISTISPSNRTNHILFVFALLLTLASLGAAYTYYSDSTKSLTAEAARNSTEAANDDVVELISNVIAEEALSLITTYEELEGALDWETYAQTIDQ